MGHGRVPDYIFDGSGLCLFQMCIRDRDNTYYLVLNTEIIGLSEAEKRIVANVIRFNSNGEVPEYAEVAGEMDHMDYVRMLKMAAILRLANGMDRSHLQRIQDVRVSVKEDVYKRQDLQRRFSKRPAAPTSGSVR